jgi:phosphohistidine phosphatase
MTVEFHLLRHAHAGDPAKWGGSDADRPLSAKGRDQAERLGAHLAAIGFAPDAVVTSPKVRARETAQLVTTHLRCGYRVDDRLGAPLSPAVIEQILADAGDPVRPVLVGHDPDFSELLALLTGAGEITMRKGAIARVDIERPLAIGRGVLRWLLPPDLIPNRR